MRLALSMCGKSVGENRINLTNEEAITLIEWKHPADEHALMYRYHNDALFHKLVNQLVQRKIIENKA